MLFDIAQEFDGAEQIGNLSKVAIRGDCSKSCCRRELPKIGKSEV